MRDEKEERCKQGQTNNKAKQHSTPKAVTFPKKNELPRVGLEPTTLYTLDMYVHVYTCTCTSHTSSYSAGDLREIFSSSMSLSQSDWPPSATLSRSPTLLPPTTLPAAAHPPISEKKLRSSLCCRLSLSLCLTLPLPLAVAFPHCRCACNACYTSVHCE